MSPSEKCRPVGAASRWIKAAGTMVVLPAIRVSKCGGRSGQVAPGRTRNGPLFAAIFYNQLLACE
jgi:hypothetical protein